MYRSVTTTATHIILIAIIAIVLAVSIYIYPSLPATIASHWNAAGEVNGYMPKFWGVFIFPIMLAFLYVIYAAIPYLDPHHENIEQFRSAYNTFWIGLFVFFLYIFKLTVAWNYSGERFDLSTMLAPALALLFLMLGWLMPKTKRNWFVGIRTPWTLSSDSVWDKTHKLGGTLFMLSAIGPAILFFMPNAGDIPIMVLLVGPIILSALISVVYSFLEFQKERGR